MVWVWSNMVLMVEASKQNKITEEMSSWHIDLLPLNDAFGEIFC